MKKIKVLFVAAELTPLAKVGGLADVVGALPKNLIKHGVDIRIVIPKYGIIDEKKYPIKKIASGLRIPYNGQDEIVSVYQTVLPQSKVPVYLVDNQRYLGQGGVYIEMDASMGGITAECQRFSFFARSVLGIFEGINFWPDILHCHDWHVGLVPFFKNYMAETEPRLKNIKCHLTIHNLAYQGKYNYEEALNYLGLLKDKEIEQKLVRFDWQTIDYLQQAIRYSDLINTVSPSYAQEILTKEFGEGLENFLEQRKKDLSGILNGIDAERFNPQTDRDIIKRYSLSSIKDKIENKSQLQKMSGLAVNTKVPLFGNIGRLVDQKGIDLLIEIIPELMKKNCQLAILGTGFPHLEAKLKELARQYPKKISVSIAFDAKLAQIIYAGSDFFLMPSRFEPCGLGQLIAMRYGTVPLVRSTGGLKDTVVEFDSLSKEGTGFLFHDYSPESFLGAIDKSLEIYQNKEAWTALLENDMRQDYSWDRSSRDYLKLYQKLIK